MIRINLLGGERQKVRKTATFDASQRITAACSLIVVFAVAGNGWWFWSLREEAAQVEVDMASAEQQATQLRSLLQEVQQFEGRRSQLQERVALIEQLRSGQSVPVQLLDHVSRSLPDMLWLTSLQHEAGAVTIEGRSTTLIGLSDFVGNLGNGTVLEKPIEIVNSQLEPPSSAPGEPSVELIKFTVKAQLAGAKPSKPAGRKGGSAAAPKAAS